MRRTIATLLAASLTSFTLAQDTAAPASKTPAQKATEKAPTPQDLIDRNIRVMGGKDAWMNIKDITMKGEFAVPGAGMGGPILLRQKAPNLQLTTIMINGIGEIKEGFDGTNGWDLNPMTGPTLKKGVALEQAARSAKLSSVLNPLEDLTDPRTTGTVEFGGQSCWELVANGPGGEVKMYFAKSDGSMSGMTMTADSPMGKINVITEMKDLKKFGDVSMSTEMTISMMGQAQTIKISDVNFEPIDESVFALPPQIAAMVKARDEAKKKAESEKPALPTVTAE
ncbi:MAG TPA: hypothetical protein DCX60_10450 [Phycisphaerales bacterium]|nr:hypothetical protein [Phycisphaerales bacterium]|tara:strand:- start:327 stop:1172 length:846 start_codon:yes stop_codon:yes gene_type:complete